MAARPAIIATHPELVDRLAALHRRAAPEGLPAVPLHHASSSAFRFVAEPAVGRDVDDASAVAQLADQLVPAMYQQLRRAFLAPAPAGRGEDRPARASASRLRMPATTAAREASENGVRALVRQLDEEAAQLFGLAIGLAPTDAFARFGAAIAARQLGQHVVAAQHLERASRYLLADDPAGACYAAILAAGLHEGHGATADAVATLRRTVERLDRPCPALSLHLARLENGQPAQNRMAAALAVDPLTQADLAALGLVPDPGVVSERLTAVRREIHEIDRSIVELGAMPPPPVTSPAGLELVAAELTLANRVAVCREALELGRARVEQARQERIGWELEWRSVTKRAEADLDHRSVFAPVGTNLLLGVAVLMVGLVGLTVIRSAPGSTVVLGPALALLLTALTANAIWRTVSIMRAHAGYQQARSALAAQPRVRAGLADSMAAEFTRSRQFRRTERLALTRLAPAMAARHSLVPRCPRFVASVPSVGLGRTREVARAE